MRKRKKRHDPERPSTSSAYTIKPAAHYTSFPLTKYLPVEVGNFSTNLKGDLINCDTAYFSKLNTTLELPVDLNTGMEEYYERLSKRATSEKGMPIWQTMLRWICESKFDLRDVDIIARRGILKGIGYTLYNYHNNPWTFRICKYKGKMYLYETESEGSSPPDDHHKKFLYWGIRFEQLFTLRSDDPSARKNSYSMVKGTIGKYRVLLGAEIDAARPPTQRGVDPSAEEYVEIKTCVERALRNKLGYGWLQCYLAGIKTLCYGFRDGEGWVGKVQEYRVDYIESGDGWSGSAMFGLISGILNWVFSRLGEGKSGVLMYKGNRREVQFSTNGEHFLPSWYTDYLDTIRA